MAQKLVKFGSRLATEVAPKAIRVTSEFAKVRGGRFWHYAKVELRPPMLTEFPVIQESINNIIRGAKTKKFLTMPVREVWLNTLVCLEILFLFFIGEILGKGCIIGYYIPGAWTVHGEDQRKKH
ncbi:ATP synthase subunit g, mitochondrial-like [Mytilus trossulus]|uniref:ATP synthase subunit g, mitochondrial-like n=1 Tax=Mytilus trossulus TaxID=6551 RepID=UPI003004E4CF